MKVHMLLFVTLLVHFVTYANAAEETKPVVIGVPTLLSGDWAGLGQNIVKTTETYQRHYGRHPMKFMYEDAKISSKDGLSAYQSLINGKHVDVLIGATSSNGTMAGAPLINRSKTVMITPVTGGSNVDGAGEWIFRIGNSDVLNGRQQAEILLRREIKRAAVLSEETEYTLDIAKEFERALKAGGGEIAFSSTFVPTETDFRTQLSAIVRSNPAAVFIPTQTGSALALILRQLSLLGDFKGELYTTFTAADNPDARAAAGDLFKGVGYLAPAYDSTSTRLQKFLERYKADHKIEPLIPFHTAATVDALDLLQLYLDKAKTYEAEGFKTFLLNEVKDYKGLLGTYSLDEHGNANTGFVERRIE